MLLPTMTKRCRHSMTCAVSRYHPGTPIPAMRWPLRQAPGADHGTRIGDSGQFVRPWRQGHSYRCHLSESNFNLTQQTLFCRRQRRREKSSVRNTACPELINDSRSCAHRAAKALIPLSLPADPDLATALPLMQAGCRRRRCARAGRAVFRSDGRWAGDPAPANVLWRMA